MYRVIDSSDVMVYARNVINKKRHMFYRFIQIISSILKDLETVHALYEKSRKEGNLLDTE
ncbi:hypothetical protein KSI01_21190 [Kurthia sibirica]|nr:hypothetical protein KSI01_21190 [Kurthia sibirica]